MISGLLSLPARLPSRMFQPDILRRRFPVFSAHPDLVYLDSASTSQRVDSAISAVHDFYSRDNASTHRGLYELSAEATRAYESVRKLTAQFIGSAHPHSISFTKGATESINIVANSYRSILKKGDRIIVTMMEHHANFIPWQVVAREVGAELIAVPVLPSGELDLKSLTSSLDSRTRLVCVAHVSNVLGTINPVEEIIAIAHKENIPVLIDAAQSAGHLPIDVDRWDADYLSFSAHKMYGPMGTGVLYVHPRHHEHIRPLQFGGGAIRQVSIESTEWLPYPYGLEAGTPHVAGVLGLGEAIKFIEKVSLTYIATHEQQLAQVLRNRLKENPKVQLMGEAKMHAGIVSFQVKDIHPHDVATMLAERNIAARAGHHCAEPLHHFLSIPASIRVSFGVYNSTTEIDQLMEALTSVQKFWS